jgi:hypothetical protein
MYSNPAHTWSKKKGKEIQNPSLPVFLLVKEGRKSMQTHILHKLRDVYRFYQKLK